jgi:hypothetical protein
MSRISDFNPKRNPICSNNRQGFLTVTAPFLPPGIFGRLSVVAAEHGAAQLYHGCDRCIAEYIVEAGAALFNTHFVVINTYLGVISGVKHRPSSSSSPQKTPRSKRGLQRELHARLEFILMPRANLDDIARELVAHDGRMLSYIGMHALVLGAEDGTLVGGHTDAVGYDLDQNLIIADFRQFKGVQTQDHSQHADVQPLLS